MWRAITFTLPAVLALCATECSTGAGDPGAPDAAGDAGDPAATDGSILGTDAAALDGGPVDAGALDAGPLDAGAMCAVSGAPGVCITTADCAALGSHSSTPGLCPGPAEIQCCTDTPSVADDPPVPTGYRLMMQSEVTPDMTTWAVAILHDPVTYPMFSTTTMTFGTLTVLARVEWHPPDFLNMVVHRGVTLYEPL